ncbi:MAG: hypothetical protein JXA30_08580 [Deltaproteobacteria bacterium]|nr:hypothetical protein [Deltaproteobacteria bacterium]
MRRFIFFNQLRATVLTFALVILACSEGNTGGQNRDGSVGATGVSGGSGGIGNGFTASGGTAKANGEAGSSARNDGATSENGKDGGVRGPDDGSEADSAPIFDSANEGGVAESGGSDLPGDSGGVAGSESNAARAFAARLGRSHFMIGMGNDLANDHNQDGAYTLGVTLDLHYAYLVGLPGQGG